MSAGTVAGSVVVGSSRAFTLDLTNTDTLPGTVVEVGVALDVPLVVSAFSGVARQTTPQFTITLQPNSGAVSVPITIDATGLDPTSPNVDLNLALRWRVVGESTWFRYNVTSQVQQVTAVVTPLAFDYSLDLTSGVTRFSASSLVPQGKVSVFNTLCANNSVLHWSVSWCNAAASSASTWFSLDAPATFDAPVTLEPGKGLPDSFSFALDLSRPGLFPPVTNRTTVLRTCLRVRLELRSLGITTSSDVDITVTPIRQCPLGYTSPSGTSREGCTPCDTGTYAASLGSSSCTACPANLPVTLQRGASSVAECGARPGSFKGLNDSVIDCRTLVGADCTAAGLALETMPLLANFWRPSRTSLQIVRCKHDGYCRGGAFPAFALNTNANNNTATGSTNATSTSSAATLRARRLASASANDSIVNATTTFTTDALCILHHHGVMCELCSPGYVKRTPARVCSPCTSIEVEEDQRRITGILVALVLSLLAVVVAISVRRATEWRRLRALGSRRRSRQPNANANAVQKTVSTLENVMCAGHVFDKLRILVAFFQVVASMAVIFEPELPDFFREVQKVFAVLSLDLVQLFDFGCTLTDQSFYVSLLIATLLPIGIIATTITIGVVVYRYGPVAARRDAHGLTYTLVLLTLFLSYPSVSSQVLRTFSCTRYDDVLVLNADPALECAGPRYDAFAAYAGFMCFLWVAGVPASYFLVLLRVRDRLNPRRLDPALTPDAAYRSRERDMGIVHLRFLTRAYTTDAWAFEVFDTVRRLAQASLFVFVSKGTALQMTLQLIISVVAIFILSAVKPYQSATQGYLALFAQYDIFFITFLSFVLHEERRAIVGSTTPFDLQGVAVGMIVLLVAMPAITAVLILVDGVAEWRERQSDKRARVDEPKSTGGRDEHVDGQDAVSYTHLTLPTTSRV